MKKGLELYVHIPFCARKCDYCDFLSAPADTATKQKYVQALICEIKSRKREFADYEVTTVFVGGGTPSILAGEEISRIFKALRESFAFREDLEITMEVNPGTVTEEKFQFWKKAGVNRLSIGLQSADDRELKLLGRIHTFADFLYTYETARKSGFANINIDLISALPGQSVSAWERTLRKAAELSPEHISAYSLIIEEGTPFYRRYGASKEDGAPGDAESPGYEKAGASGGESVCDGKRYPALPDEETDRLIYKTTGEILREYGYVRYEISNYAKEGYACRHNLGYWERKEYLGLGLGAASLVNETRFKNTEELETYLEIFGEEKREYPSAVTERERLDKKEQMEEFMFLGLRKMKGISQREFARQFGETLEEVYGEEIKELTAEGLLEQEGEWLRLTEFGIDVSNYVFEKFF